jgi:hypothetical protein
MRLSPKMSSRTTFYAAVTVLAFVSVGPANAQSVAGSIKGNLYGEDGSPIGGARVTANVELPRNKAIPAPIATGSTLATATTAADGSFMLDELPAGSYVLCAQAQQAVHLDPCHWLQTPPSVVLAAGQNITGHKLNLIRGAQLQVRLEDPQHFLNAPADKNGIPHVLMGVVTAAGQFYPVFVSGKDNAGVSHTLTIPVDTNLRFTVYSKHVKLTDGSDKPLDPAGVTILLRHDSQATGNPSLVFHIVGAN